MDKKLQKNKEIMYTDSKYNQQNLLETYKTATLCTGRKQYLTSNKFKFLWNYVKEMIKETSPNWLC